MTRMKFARTGNSKITNIKENMWKLSCKLSWYFILIFSLN
jgi:hypothetical protein